MKRNMIIVIAVIATLLTVSLGFAGRHGNSSHQGQRRAMGSAPVLEQLTLEKQQAFQALRETFQDKVHILRNQMWVKRTALRALSVNPNTKPETLTGLATEMGELRDQMYKERKAFREQVRTEIGIELREGRRAMGMSQDQGRGCNGACRDWGGAEQDTRQDSGRGNGRGRGMRRWVDCPNNQN